MIGGRGVGLPRQSRGELEVPGRPARPRRRDAALRLRRIGKSDAAHHGLDVLALGLGRRPGLAHGDVPLELDVVSRVLFYVEREGSSTVGAFRFAFCVSVLRLRAVRAGGSAGCAYSFSGSAVSWAKGRAMAFQ